MNLIGNWSKLFCADRVGDAVEDKEVGTLVVAVVEDDADDRVEVDKRVEDWVVVVKDGRNGITIAGFEVTDTGVGEAAEE